MAVSVTKKLSAQVYPCNVDTDVVVTVSDSPQNSKVSDSEDLKQVTNGGHSPIEYNHELRMSKVNPIYNSCNSEPTLTLTTIVE
jgi:hypothetical protein